MIKIVVIVLFVIVVAVLVFAILAGGNADDMQDKIIKKWQDDLSGQDES